MHRQSTLAATPRFDALDKVQGSGALLSAAPGAYVVSMTNSTASSASSATADVALEGVHHCASRAKAASRKLATASTATKNLALLAIADALEAEEVIILAANAQDMERGRASGLPEGLLDRLLLNSERLKAISESVRDLVGLADPVGDVASGSTLPNGIQLRQVRVPMGVVGMIYEARPNVTVDAAAIALKSGNAVILRGGSAARSSNGAFVEVIGGALEACGLPADLVISIDEFGREGAVALMQARGLVDVLVPRGGAELIQTVVREASVPVIETGVGNCHVYVDAEVDEDQALAVVLNSKIHRPSVCNAAETVLVNQAVAPTFTPRLLRGLAEAGVRIHADQATAGHAPAGVVIEAATEDDWAREYLAPEVAIRQVADLGEAIEHIRRWSSGHTDAICTRSLPASQRFTAEVDSAVVNVNVSTRFTDGGQFGLGAEIGISTQKLHARGPMGLTALTTTKWIAVGEGQIR